VTRPQWFTGSTSFATILVQEGSEKHPDLPNVPMAEEFASSEVQRQLIRAATSTLAISKPLIAPPGLPADRAAALRQAFDAMMKDPELLREAESAKIDLSVKSASQVMAIVDDVLKTPPQVADQLKHILEPA
jgi:tripartite-type tricarboxylate transporter receptor subunit TctC